MQQLAEFWKYYGKLRIMKKLFGTNNNRKDRIKFCKIILDLKLSGKDIFFMDESKLKCNQFVNEYIRLSLENTKN